MPQAPRRVNESTRVTYLRKWQFRQYRYFTRGSFVWDGEFGETA